MGLVHIVGSKKTFCPTGMLERRRKDCHEAFRNDTAHRCTARETRESIFRGLDQSGCPSLQATRHFWESLFHLFPAEGKAEIRTRFRSEDDRQHLGACFEMYWSGWLQRRGFTLEIHPSTGGGKSTHPDFLVFGDGKPLFYLECCVSNESDVERGEEARLSEFFDALDKIPSPDFFIHARVEKMPTISLKMTNLRAGIESWLKSLSTLRDLHSIATSDTGTLRSGAPFVIDRGGGRIVLSAVQKSPSGRGKVGLRTYGSSTGPMVEGDSSKSVLRAH